MGRIYLIDVFFIIVPNSSFEYPSKDCILLLFPGGPLSDTGMTIPES